jgi:hypothetical protein
MLKLYVLILVSLLLLTVGVGCSSSDQVGVLETAVPATTNSTELSECVTVIAFFLASEHNHIGGGDNPYGVSYTSSSTITNTKGYAPLLDEYCGTYIDSQLLEHINSNDGYEPELRGPVFIGENKD